MGRKSVFGACRLCGAIGPLSFEHVPPRAAFNDRPVLRQTFARLIASEGADILDNPGGKVAQRGQGAYTLCGKCNSDTGGWYGKAYADWAYQGMRLAHYARQAPRLHFPFQIFPLRVIKQIICMFFSANHDNFRKAQPELEGFALGRERRYLDPSIRIFAFHTLSSRSRLTGVAGLLNVLDGGSYKLFSEIASSPWGYVMCLDSEPPDDRLVDISFFSTYSYNDCNELTLNFPVLPIYTWIPGDYRSRDDIKNS